MRVVKKIMWIGGMLVLVAAAVGVVKSKQQANAAFTPPLVPPVQVSSMTAELTPVTLTLPAQVTVRAETEQLLTARLTAQVMSLPVREGDVVKSGALLAQLDDRASRADASLADATLAQYRLEQASIRDQLEATRLDVQAQQDTLARLKKLAAIQAASQDQIQQQQVRLAQAEQRLSAAQSQLKAYDALLAAKSKQAEAARGALGYVALTAVQDGVVAERLVQEGDIVTAGTPLLRLVGADGGRRLLVSVPADGPAPAALLWQDQSLPLTPWPRATAQGLLTYEARVQAAELVPNRQLALPLAWYQGEGIALASGCFVPQSPKTAQVLIDRAGTAEAVDIVLEAVGQEGAVTRDARLVGQRLLCASSDVLIRLLAGRAYQVHP